MSSVWIRRRKTQAGKVRYRVEFRLGGRSTSVRYSGTFGTMREAQTRKNYVAGELAAQRIPARLADTASLTPRTLDHVAAAWHASRVDVADNTRAQHRSSMRLWPARLRARPVDAITAQDVANAIAELHAADKRRETIRKGLVALAMVFDHAGVTPNPARDKRTVKLPRETRVEPAPPSAEHVAAVFHLVPPRHRLALLWLDWSGARVSSVDHVLVSDYDEPRRRVRLRAAATKGGRGVWVDLHPDLADAVEASIGPREDRDPAARLFARSGADALRTAIAKACRAAGVPAFSPHDLRHRRVTLLHLRGVPWARIGELVGQRDLAVTANTYTHVIADETELDYANLLA